MRLPGTAGGSGGGVVSEEVGNMGETWMGGLTSLYVR